MLICQDFGFCQDFDSIKKEGGQEFRSLEVRLPVHRTYKQNKKMRLQKVFGPSAL